MNLDRIQGHWKQLVRCARQLWGRLVGNYARVVAGRRQHLRRQAHEKQLAEWLAQQHKIDPLHK